MHQTEIRPATVGDAAQLAPLLIPEDVANAAALGMNAETAIFESIKSSDKTLVVLLDDVIASMMGVAHRPTAARFWLVTARTAGLAPRAYLRAAGEAFTRLCEGEKSLISVVAVAHDRAIRLARRFGFKVSVPFHTGDGETVCILRWERA